MVADALLEAAARRFVDFGVTKTTMAEIAAAAGVTKPTLYRRYADKPAVVDALVRRETAAFTEKLARVAAAEPDAAAALEAAFATAVRWLDRHPFLRRSLTAEPQLMLPLLTEPGGPVLEAGLSAFREIVERGRRSGELRVHDSIVVAEVWWRLVLSYALTPALGVRRTDAVALRALARATLLEGLVPR